MTDPANAFAVPRPGTPAGAKAFIVTPFARMARTHAGSAMADAMVAASLAGSLFFTLPAGDARVPVLRYLVITMLPFAVVSPLIGPMIDRMKGGHRLMVIGSLLLRSLLCYLMATVINGGSLLFFLYALCLLVCQKAYQVARSALVPTVVRSATELVEANSKLSLISGISGFVGIVPAGILLKLFGPQWSLGLGMVTYAAAAVLAFGITGIRVAEESADETERHELRGAGIVMAGSAMGLIRACVGFLTLLVAFDFRGGDRPAWQFGVVGGASVISQLAGAAAGPRIRSLTSEENLLTGVLGLLVAGGLIALVIGDVVGATILGACVGFAAGGGKLAFDSILQRDAPDANRGRAFAKFETRFQVTWVIGALVPVAVTMSISVGFAVVFVLAVIALTSYAVARLAYAHRMGTHQSAATAAAVEIEDRFAEVSGEVRGRLAGAPRAAFRRIRAGRSAEDDGYDDDGYPIEPGYGAAIEAEGLGDDPASWPEPEWADGATHVATEPVTELEADHPRRRGRRRRAPEEAPTAVAAPYDDLAASSPTAWAPPDDGAEFPWQPPPEPHDDGYLADVDPDIDNPYPWTPDSPRGR
ncbi:MFS transporter [Aquihabitans sp. G128]|uniref:MFS transporter n=1 Tax=Aquihabitans sp. G128 TaxID=2849779 RepID=UPI001C22E54E|nr:MFS transporter [Aquihabitans sp. G128]QXC60451.1 MFS transporter [Aquihabitans sp. G128]